MYIHVRCLRGFEFILKIRLIEVHALLRQTVRPESVDCLGIVVNGFLLFYRLPAIYRNDIYISHGSADETNLGTILAREKRLHSHFLDCLYC